MILQDPYFQFTLGTVGDGGKNAYHDAQTVQRLLLAAGIQVPGGADGRWGEKSTKSLQRFQEQWKDQTGTEFGLPPTAPNSKPLLQPDDDWLLRMAAAAQILIPMPGQKGLSGFLQVHQWFQAKQLKYEPKHDYMGTRSRSFWAVRARANLAVQLQTASGFINRGPIMINCTTYANMMLAVFLYGNLANPCYKAGVKNIGGASAEHLSKSRYLFQLIMREETDKAGKKKQFNYFATADQISEATGNNKIYSMEIGSEPQRGVGHHAILYNDKVYQSHSACPSAADSSLDEFMSKTTPCIYLFGQ